MTQPVRVWTQQDRERIDLFKDGWSVALIADHRGETVAEVAASVNLLLEVLGEELIEVK